MSNPTPPRQGQNDGQHGQGRQQLDVRSGVAFVPPGADPPLCPFPCTRCRARGKQ